MERTFLAFSTTEALSSFFSYSKGINVSILPKMKIVKGLFTNEEVELAKTQYKATVITNILNGADFANMQNNKLE